MPEMLTQLQSALSDRYALEREIGAGGMATVFLAQDLRHSRRVAVKVLRPELAAVIGAERFLAEIKLTANLQHPHILPLFDSGAAESYLFYVMPFVEGETLRDRLTREKQLPLADAVRIAREVAAALDYAHRHGVVHRDIKPENILLHDGSALVADFGIALAASKASGARMTETGMSLGTPHYMSPEQAMGEREITPRSDVYALGAVLYEMLTGEPPFTGSTAQAVVARVLTESPRPLMTQRHTIPRHIEVAVLTALEKLPADRFATAAEFADALKEGSHTPTVPVTQAAPAAPAPRRGRGREAALAAALAVAVGAALWGWLRPSPRPLINRYSLMLRPAEALRPTAVAGNVAISPDGNRLAYIGPAEGGTRLWLREHDALRPSPIPGTESGVSPFFSPDGQHLGFIVNGRTVRTVSLTGGPPLTLSDTINSSGGDWGDDGYIYMETSSGLARIRATGGPLEPVFTMSEERREIGAEWPNVLPGGKGVLFRLRHAGQPASEFDIMAIAKPGGEAKALVRGVYGRYVHSGHLLVVTADGKLLAIPFDPGKLALTGPPVAMMDGMLRSGPFELNVAVSRNGTLVYASGGAADATRAFWVTREGAATPADTTWDPQGTLSSVAVAPDGKSVAVTLQRGVGQDIWVKRLPTGPFSRITFGDTANFRPAWTGDGRSLVYIRDNGAGSGLPYLSRADGTGRAEPLLRSRFGFGHGFESADGRWLVLRRAVNEAGAGDIYAVKRGDTTLVPLLTSSSTESGPSLSPDGRWLAYVSDESGTPEVYVRPFPDVGSARWQASLSGGTLPVWNRNGRELFYINGRQEMSSVAVSAGATFSLGEPRVLFDASEYNLATSAGAYDVSPDGRRFFMVRPLIGASETELVLVQNWFEELRARATK